MNSSETTTKINKELARLKALGINGEYRFHGSKWSLKVKLTNKQSVFICPLSKTMRHSAGKSIKYVNPFKWCEMRGLEIAE